MTWKELAEFAAQVPPSFADKPVVCRPDTALSYLVPVTRLVVTEGALDDRGPSLTVTRTNPGA